LLGLQIGLSVAVAAGLIIAAHALGARVGVSVGGGVASFAVTLLFTINVAAGPGVTRLGQTPVCHIVELHLTQPAECRPRGVASPPVGLDGSAILLADGHRLPIVRGRVESNIEVSTATGNVFNPIAEINGWAASVGDRRPASGILVFSSGGRFVGAIRPTKPRADVAAAFHDQALTQSGFMLSFPIKIIPHASGTPRLQLFAVAGDVASRMAFHCTGPAKQLGC
jgi:hypothetical protein